LWIITLDDEGAFLSEERLTREGGSGGHLGSIGAQAFGCIGGGASGGVAGLCGTDSEIFGFAGVGTPGISFSGGVTTDVDGLLTGPGLTVVGPDGAGVMMGANGATVVVGTPGAGATIGINLSDGQESLNQSGELLVDAIDSVVPDNADGFFDAAAYVADAVGEAVGDAVDGVIGLFD